MYGHREREREREREEGEKKEEEKQKQEQEQEEGGKVCAFMRDTGKGKKKTEKTE